MVDKISAICAILSVCAASLFCGSSRTLAGAATVGSNGFRRPQYLVFHRRR